MGPRHETLKHCSFYSVALGALSCGLFAPAARAQQPLLEAATRPAMALPNAPGFLQTEAPARIVGTIFDVNGGLVPGATITVLDKDGKEAAKATSNSEAHFEATGLPAGSYKVRVAATGLKTLESPVVVLRSGESYNLPETALPIATADQTVNVVLTQEMIADQELADETKQRVLGIFPNFYTSYEWNAAPLNTKQKFRVAFKATTDPLIFVTTGIVSGIQYSRNTYPEYGSGPGGFAEYYGAQYGNAVIGRFIGAAILPSIFRQDPRYFYMGPPSTTGQRVRHALAFSVTARSDKGHDGHLVPNYSHILGNFLAGYISHTYHPGGRTNAVQLGIDNALIGIGAGAVQGLTREFLFRRISSHTPQYAKGKPVGVDPLEDKPGAGTPAPKTK